MIGTAAEFAPAAKNHVFAVKTFDEPENFSASDSDSEESNSPLAKREPVVRTNQNIKHRKDILENDMMANTQTEDESTKNRQLKSEH